MTPAERAARAIHAKGGITEDLRPESCGVCRESLNDARAALTAALDSEELARVINRELVRQVRGELIELVADDGIECERSIARAVVAHLTKGDENDE